MNTLRDDFNPKFVYFSPSPAADLMTHVDDGIRAFCTDALPDGGDFVIEKLGDLPPDVTVRIDLWVEQMDDASCTYGFLCSSANGCTPYARGERTVRRAAAASNDAFRRRNENLLRDLHAFA